MTHRTRIVLVGCGGFAQEVTGYISDIRAEWLLSNREITISDLVDAGNGRFDDLAAILGRAPRKHNTYETLEDVEEKHFVLCIGDPLVREREFQALRSRNAKFFSVIHPSAYVAKTARVGFGCILAPFAFVGPHAKVGDNCVLNVRTTVGHDTNIGRSVVMSPHVDINGSVRCGASVFFGSGAIVYPGVEIGGYSKIASSAVVTRSVGPGGLVAGNPASGRKMFAVPEVAE